MLTRTGWLAVSTAALLLVGGRLLGLQELYVLAALLAAVVVLALVRIWSGTPRLQVDRALQPRRVHLGGPARVTLSVTNATGRRTPNLVLVDPVEGTVGASVALASLAPGASVVAGYRLPTDRRGVLRVGPLRAERRDPFGLAGRQLPVAGDASLTVLPGIEALPPLPRAGGHDEPLDGVTSRTSAGTGAEDLSSLRPYVPGDDLRRVHWPSSAKGNDLLVRQDEQHRQGHVTVVLDGRRDRIGEAAFERAVSAAASVVHAASLTDDLVRLVGTDGSDSGLVSARSSADQLLGQLAVVARTDGGAAPDLGASRGRASGLLVWATGAPSADDLGALEAARSFGRRILITTEAVPAIPASDGAPTDHVDLGAAGSLLEAWDRVSAGRGGRR